MAKEPAQLQLAVLMFTDIVNSVSLQKKLGTAAYTSYISRHDEIFKACLAQVPGARILNETGDGFLVRMNSSSDAVDTALRLQFRLHSEICEGEPMAMRIGLHSGEITEMHEGLRGETRAVGMAINLAARIMDLAEEGQILMTRAVFDDARQFTRSYPEIDGVDSAELPPLLWPAYGRYIFKGNDEPMEIYGVGAEGITPLVRPEGSEKAKRAVAADEEATLGWRPGAGLAIPRREDWVIDRKIGEGGFGEVWLAQNQKSRMERVFKFCFDPDRLRSFKRELTLFRLLRDALGSRRDIAALYEVSVEAPPYYLESEYVPTGNIAEWFASKGGIEKVPLSTRLQIMAKAARAAAAAHSVGIIHKDIKPSNILIAEENGLPEPRLSDFGIGTLADTSQLGSMGITSKGFTESVILESEGSQSFTHLYAPPEYLVGKPASVRGDIYSLGVMLYQVAVGDLNRPLGTGWRRSIENPLLADDIRRCVDVDPERRFQSASHLAEHLEQLDQRHAEAEEELRVEQLKQNAIRRKRTTMLTVSIACGLALLTAVLGLGYIEQRDAKDDADEQRRHAENATQQLATQASQSDFLLAGQLLARDKRSEALVYLARAVKRDDGDVRAGRKLMATLAMSRFLPLRVPPITTLPPPDERTRPSSASVQSIHRHAARDVSPNGAHLAALFMGNQGEELHVWNLSGAVSASEPLEWQSSAQSERVLDIAFVSDQAVAFITQGDDGNTTLHIWEKSPQWAWVRSDPVGTVNDFSGFIANNAFWVREQRLTGSGGRRSRSAEFVLHHLKSGTTTTLPAPRGRILALQGFAEGGAISAMIAVHEMGPEMRVSAWSTKFSPVERDLRSSGEDRPHPRGRPPFGGTGDDGAWRTYSRSSPWSGPPISIAVSPDGRVAAVPEPDGSVGLWSLENFTGDSTPLTSIQKANDLATGLAFSSDSRRLAVGYIGSAAFVYDVESGAKSLGPLQHEGGVMGIQFSADGTQLLTRSLDNTARLWDAMFGTPRSEPMRHDSYVMSGDFSTDGKSAVTIGYDGVAKAWNLAGGSAQGGSIPSQNDHEFSAISSNLKIIFTTVEVSGDTGDSYGFEGYLSTRRQHVVKGKPLPVGPRFSGSRFTSDGQALIAVRINGAVTIRNVTTGADETFRIGEAEQRIQFRAISGDGSTIAVVAQDPSQSQPRFLLSLWRRDGTSYRTVAGIPSDKENTAVALNHDGTRMVTSHEQFLEVWNLDKNGAYTSKSIGSLSVSTTMAMTREGDRFVVGTAEGTLQYWSFEGHPLTRPLKQGDPIIAVALGADGVTAAAATASLAGRETARVQVWDLESQETISPALRFFGTRKSDVTADSPWQQALAKRSSQVVFNRDQSQVMLHYLGGSVTWDLAPSFDDGKVPDIVPSLATAIGGFKFSTTEESAKPMDVLSAVPYEKLAQLTADYSAGKKSRTNSQVHRWIDWLLANPAGRAIAPTLDVTNDTFTDHLVEQGSIASLHEARLRNPNDPRVTTRYFSELSEISGATVKPEEAAWFAEMATQFVKAETARQRSEPAFVSRHQEVASALDVIWKFRPDDPDQLEYQRTSLKAALSPALERNPDDLNLWFSTGLALHRMGILLDRLNHNSAVEESYSYVALQVFAFLAEEDHDGAAQRLRDIVATQNTDLTAPDEIANDATPRERNRRPRGRNRDLIGSLLKERLPSAIATIDDLPAWLENTLLFYADDSLTPTPATNSSILWMQRAFAQASLGMDTRALHAADYALKIGIKNSTSERRLHRLRAKLLTSSGDIDSAHAALAKAEGIPARPTNISKEMIDLSPFFSNGLRIAPGEKHEPGPRNMDRPSLAIPNGILESRQRISFDARGIVFPAHSDRSRPFPPVAIRPPLAIPVAQTASQLHFLHAAITPGRGSDQSRMIGEYIVRYEDGSEESIPIRAGIEVGDWKPNPGDDSAAPEEAPTVAWAGYADDSVVSTNVLLYGTTWDNPKPNVIIKSFDFIITSPQNRPFLVAVTAER